MGIVSMNIEALRTAGAKIGIFGDANLAEHLGVDFARPVSLATVAVVLTRLPTAGSAAFSMVDVSDDERRPDGGWPVALAGQ